MKPIMLDTKIGKASSHGKIALDWLDFLWHVIVCAKADYKSEISEKTGVLQAHHLAGKPNKYLRYFVPENGICITNGEHGWGAHGSMDRQLSFQDAVKALRGNDIYERLKIYRQQAPKPYKSHEIEEYLLGEIVPLLPVIVKYFQAKEYSKNNKFHKFYLRLFEKIAK